MLTFDLITSILPKDGNLVRKTTGLLIFLISIIASTANSANPMEPDHEHLALLKIAQRLSRENSKTIEDYARSLSYRVSQNDTPISEVFAQAHPDKTGSSLKKYLSNFDFNQIHLRARNKDICFIARVAHLKLEIKFTNNEIDILNCDATLDAYSKTLARWSGLHGDRRQPLVAEFQASINSTQNYSTMTPELQMNLKYKVKSPPRLNWISDFNSYKVFKENMLHLQNESRIHYYHQHSQAPEEYAIFDRSRNLISLFSAQGARLATYKAQGYEGDEINAGGAGIYRVYGWSQDTLFLASQRDQSIRPLIQTNSSLNRDLLLYILPQTKHHQFFIRDNQLVFMSSPIKKNRPSYNYSPSNPTVSKTSFEKSQSNSFTQEFMETLEQEKQKLSILLKLEDDEYNNLAEFSVGVLLPETQNASSLKYYVKEKLPWLVALAKGNGVNTSQNSRGATQIKKIPALVQEHYGFSKEDLESARAAAVTTLVFASELLKELRQIAHYHPQISEANIHQYLYYLYQGRRSEIIKATATPYQNISIRKIMGQNNSFRITREPLK
ncbi:MAG: hypothetical protein ACLGGX_08380 [Bdellovibrionia bacterium]